MTDIRSRGRAILCALAVAILGCEPAPTEAPPPTSFHLEPVSSGLDRPVAVQRDAGGLLVALQTGLIVRLDGTIVHDLRGVVPPDLDLVGGLLNFLVAGEQRFVFLTSGDNHHTLIARIAGSRLDTLLLTTELRVEHHGGGLAWHEGRLLAAIGEGDTGTGRGPGVAGKVVAIDPATRTFDVIASGLRNPWRIALSGDSLWITDAGDRLSEEVDVLDLRAPGADFGWGISEGTTCTAESCAGVRWPIFAYPTGQGCSTVVGGAWYAERFWFGDYCRRWVSTLDRSGTETRRFDLPENVVSITAATDGGPFIVTSGGRIFRVVADD